MLCILKTIGIYILLIIVTINLLGLFVRGLFHSRQKLVVDGKVYHETSKMALIITNILFFILIVSLLFALYYFWNYGVVIAALLLMISRLPDLLYEIKTGIKVTRKNRRKGFYDYFFMLFFWGALPVLWYSLCRL